MSLKPSINPLKINVITSVRLGLPGVSCLCQSVKVADNPGFAL